jgi:hypothetical protein
MCLLRVTGAVLAAVKATFRRVHRSVHLRCYDGIAGPHGTKRVR